MCDTQGYVNNTVATNRMPSKGCCGKSRGQMFFLVKESSLSCAWNFLLSFHLLGKSYKSYTHTATESNKVFSTFDADHYLKCDFNVVVTVILSGARSVINIIFHIHIKQTPSWDHSYISPLGFTFSFLKFLLDKTMKG